MSSTWQPYVDENLVGSGKLSKAIIISNADGAIWASSPSEFSPSTAEIKSLLEGFRNVDNIRSEGLKLAGQKYIVLQSGDGRSIYAKKGEDGVIAVKTKQTILAGLYGAPITAAEAAKIVENLADYLISVDF